MQVVWSWDVMSHEHTMYALSRSLDFLWPATLKGRRLHSYGCQGNNYSKPLWCCHGDDGDENNYEDNNYNENHEQW